MYQRNQVKASSVVYLHISRRNGIVYKYPIIFSGKWGMKWARDQIDDEELDIELLMQYLERSIEPKNLLDTGTILHFKFHDLKILQDWWVIIELNDIDVYLNDPSKEMYKWITTVFVP